MGKGKQVGGHLPLTHHERKEFSKDGYGTTTARLGQDSQYTFGNCGLSLHPAKDNPVASPSGFIYERPTILEYLLTKTQELKQEQQDYDRWMVLQDEEQQQAEEKKRKADVEKFENAQKIVTAKKQKAEVNHLKRTSYWLADSQPDTSSADGSGKKSSSSTTRLPPPKRPPSPNTKRPLRRKELIDLDLKRNDDEQVICAVSEKSITTQQALALITKSDKPAQVVLEQVYFDLGKEKLCPVTGKKISKILKLHKGGSSFASTGGVVEAKLYRPTMT